jgi:hypothetical protein
MPDYSIMIINLLFIMAEKKRSIIFEMNLFFKNLIYIYLKKN